MYIGRHRRLDSHRQGDTNVYLYVYIYAYLYMKRERQTETERERPTRPPKLVPTR